jgi:outer membrane protein assembly factor BamD
MPRSLSAFSRSSLSAFPLALSLCVALLLSGCGMFGDKLDPQKNWSAEQFYKAAKDELESGNYPGAVKLYEALEAKYPFGKYAQQAQLDTAYAYYKEGDTAQAVSAADKFIKLHPNHVAVDYAIYLKGLAYYKLDQGFLGAMMDQDMSERDPKALRESFDMFKDLAERFPDSKYADDARARMAFLINTLARHEVQVAQYYFNRGAFLAAANRAQTTLTRYPQAPANQDALVMMIKAYEKLGMSDLAADTKRVLQKNFPNNEMVGSPGKSADKPWWKPW